MWHLYMLKDVVCAWCSDYNIMSNINLYLSQYDKDKAEAVKIAECEASRTSRHLELIIIIVIEIVTDKWAGLESKELKLLDLVQAPGDYINSDDSSNRIKCTYLHEAMDSIGCWHVLAAASYLADVISAVPPRVLSLQQSKFEWAPTRASSL